MALAKYDKNKDGIINSDDDIFGDLLVWSDTNSNGVSEKGELRSLADLKVVSILLQHNLDRIVSQDGNLLVEHGHYTKQDGTKHELVDVHFHVPDGISLLDDVQLELSGISPDNGTFGFG